VWQFIVPGIIPQSFSPSALLEAQERYFLSTRKDIILLSASTHNYLTRLLCDEIHWLFISVLLNSLYDTLTVFKNNILASYSNFWQKVSDVFTVEIMMGLGVSKQTICARENIASYISKASIIMQWDIYMGADKSSAQPTFRFILFDG
jgi:hypothetical protein